MYAAYSTLPQIILEYEVLLYKLPATSYIFPKIKSMYVWVRTAEHRSQNLFFKVFWEWGRERGAIVCVRVSAGGGCFEALVSYLC